jgi:ornithine carbamoyltransferase
MESGHLLEIGRLSRFQFLDLLETAAVMNASPARWRGSLTGKVVGAIFEKPSTRTRASVAAAAARLGMQVVFLSPAELQISRGETWHDTGRVLSSYFDVLVLRTFRHSRVCELAEASSVPVINALTDDHHPCQALADVLTIRDHFGDLAGVSVAYIGDARSNVWRSLAEAVALCGMSMVVASPPGYEPDPLVLQGVSGAAAEQGGSIRVVCDPAEAVTGADVIYPEVWVPMGLEHERARRVADLAAYRVDEALFATAKPAAVLMHCLPAFRGEEVTSAVLDGPRSLAWRQAGNRLPTTQSIMHGMLTGRTGFSSRAPIG